MVDEFEASEDLLQAGYPLLVPGSTSNKVRLWYRYMVMMGTSPKDMRTPPIR